MRIGVSCALLKRQNFGVGRLLQGLIEALLETEADHTVVLFQPRHGGLAFSPSTGERRAEVWEWPRVTGTRLGRLVGEQLLLPGDAREARLDVIHAPAYIAPVLAPVPTVLFVHDLLTVTGPQFCKRLNRLHHHVMLERSIRRAERIVTPSRHVRALVVSRYNLFPGNVEVVAPGVDERFRKKLTAQELSRFRKRYGLPERFVLWLGNVEPKKNLPRLLQAMARVRREGLDMPLVLGGGEGWGGTRRSKLMSERVRWLGYVAAGDLPALYQAARVFAFPSLAEGYGVPPIEALASGTPVVASAIPSIMDLDPGAAAIVDPLDVDGMAQEILRLSRDDEYHAALSRRGREATSELSWAKHAREMLEVYRAATQTGTSIRIKASA